MRLSLNSPDFTRNRPGPLSPSEHGALALDLHALDPLDEGLHHILGHQIPSSEGLEVVPDRLRVLRLDRHGSSIAPSAAGYSGDARSGPARPRSGRSLCWSSAGIHSPERSAKTSPQRQRLLIGLTSTPGPAKWPVRASLRRWARRREVTSSRKSARRRRRASSSRVATSMRSMPGSSSTAATSRSTCSLARRTCDGEVISRSRISTPSRRAMASRRRLDSAASPAARSPPPARPPASPSMPNPSTRRASVPDRAAFLISAAPEARGVCSHSRCRLAPRRAPSRGRSGRGDAPRRAPWPEAPDTPRARSSARSRHRRHIRA